MALMRFLVIGFVAAVLVACGDDDSSDFATRPSGDSSFSSVTPQSSDSETSVSSSSTKPSSSSVESSSSSSVPEGYVDPSTVVAGTMTDERDGQTYKTVTIGTQTWMAENLNYAYTGVPYLFDENSSDSNSWCYKNDSLNCVKYGRLYTWAAAMDSVGTWSANGKGCGDGKTCSPTYPVRGICPEGWHLPDTTEWHTLFTAVGGKSTAGKMLKSTSGWNSSGNGTDAYAFSALPAGGRYDAGGYGHGGAVANFWSSSQKADSVAYHVLLFYYLDVAEDHTSSNKYYGFSVRCVQDSE